MRNAIIICVFSLCAIQILAGCFKEIDEVGDTVTRAGEMVSDSSSQSSIDFDFQLDWKDTIDYKI